MKKALRSLRTVLSLHLVVQNKSGSEAHDNITAVETTLHKAFNLLAGALPALKCVTGVEGMPLVCFKNLGKSCPLLSHLTLHVWSCPGSFLHDLVQQQPSLLPNLTSLSLTGVLSQLDGTFPDMSQNTSIVRLTLPYNTCQSSTPWLLFPPQLRHLCFGTFSKRSLGLPAASSATSVYLNLFRNLVSLKVDEAPMPLHALAQILAVAPALKSINVGGHTADACIECDLDLATISDLRVVHERMRMNSELLKDALFRVECMSRDGIEGPVLSFIAQLPCMTCITRCTFLYFEPEELAPLLRVFPNVTQLTLEPSWENKEQSMNDVHLQDLTSCLQLTRLVLQYCMKVTSMGLLALCLRLPGLRTVILAAADDVEPRLSESDLQGCMHLLQRHGQQVEVGNKFLDLYGFPACIYNPGYE